MKKVLQIAIPLLVAVALVWGIFSFVDYEAIFNNIKLANGYLISIAIIVSLLSHLSRAYRWKLLLEPLGFTPSLKNSFIAVMTAYFGNIFIPRGGEVMRCAVLNRSDKVPFTTSFATVVAERIFDLLCLLSLIGIAFVLEFDRFMEFFKVNVFATNPNVPEPSFPVKYIVLGLLVFGGVLFFSFKNQLLKIGIIKKGYDFAVDLITQAINSFRLLKKKKGFVLHTVFIWFGYYFMTYIIFFALPFTSHLDMMAGLVILIVGGLGMAAPASGGIGPFHIMVAGALTLFYGLTKNDGVAFAFVLHTSQLIAMLVIGGICAFWSLFLEKKSSEEAE